VTLRTLWRRFLASSEGNVAIISAFAFLPMLVVAGGATDIARHEAYRVQLQDGVDRAVLAAASLTQTRPIEATVREYLKGLPFIDEVTLDFAHTTTTNQRQVTVSARYEMETAFLPLVGISSIGVKASATALERRQNIEISLILDISGSMREGGTPNRLARMKPAAKGFIDAILTTQSASYTSVSLIPYAGSVNPGAAVFNYLAVPRQHNYSSCVEFLSTDYTAGMIGFSTRTQIAHFTNSHQGVSYPNLEWSWCPYEATSISYLSNDATYLKGRIDALKMHDGTGTAIAMKWGLLLLDPDARSMVAASGTVPAAFASRPGAFNSADTIKFIVLMTDGNISPQYRPKVYPYPRPKDPDNTTPQSDTNARDRMYEVCTRAKNNGVTVFTIGFDLSSTGKTQMRTCASSASHFYDVNSAGLDINTAFQSIATAIQRIKLTQ
jgi:Flp pilus assembly protein TadG